MEMVVDWAPNVVLLVGGMSIVCIIIHIIQSTVRPPKCCHNSSGTLIIGLPQVNPHNTFQYVRLESQNIESDSWHKTPFPVYNV
uniref:Secreted protein n=1 Tax=Caenorhabditis tropicalis TaxID=1561998 RepID=A0A1I7U7C6_9PELO